VQASKWLKSALLLSPEEMARLFEHFAPAELYVTGSVVTSGEGKIAPADFLEVYCNYINQLRSGLKPKKEELQPWFSCSATCDSASIHELNPAPGKKLLRVMRPVIQFQHHTMDYSPADGKFHSMVLGHQTIDWGIQISYPQLFQDPATMRIVPVDGTDNFPNTPVFKIVQRWLREHTIPTPFIVQGVTINAPIRLGKECLDWINSHPDLNRKGITIDTSRNHSDRK
jgi:hypothetical protein